MSKAIEKDLTKKLDEADFEKRQAKFGVELQLLSEKLNVGIVPLIYPNGPQIQLIDLKKELK